MEYQTEILTLYSTLPYVLYYPFLSYILMGYYFFFSLPCYTITTFMPLQVIKNNENYLCNTDEALMYINQYLNVMQV